ncbi:MULTISPECIES: ATP-binding protein [Pantoea]|uniref:ATP-binding protein n=1 Tax=Pantoea TaxID=53335 RepID=UPI001F0C53B8|nr:MULTISPECIES: ATP-binding protein [Pantoea]
MSQVSTDMAHDLRTPISTLIGQTEVALSQTHSVVDYLALHGELLADPQLLQRALANLIANALRYGDQNSTIRVFNQDHSLTVENHGPALSEEQQARIFDRFWRADSSRHQGSSGLGLSIVRSIMRLHQGSCEMHSEKGVNRFTLRFPY